MNSPASMPKTWETVLDPCNLLEKNNYFVRSCDRARKLQLHSSSIVQMLSNKSAEYLVDIPQITSRPKFEEHKANHFRTHSLY